MVVFGSSSGHCNLAPVDDVEAKREGGENGDGSELVGGKQALVNASDEAEIVNKGQGRGGAKASGGHVLVGRGLPQRCRPDGALENEVEPKRVMLEEAAHAE